MSRPLRSLAIVAAIAVTGLVLLGWMGNRYARILERQDAPAATAERRRAVEITAFISVRRQMKAQLAGTEAAPGGQVLTRVLGARARALADQKMDLAVYVRVRERYRSWRRGSLAAVDPWAAALASRRRELEQVELGDYEPFDS